MTRWVENPEGGRARGPSGIADAWAEVLRNPWQFFETRISPGDQAPGLTFAAAVVLVEETTRLALVPGAAPVFQGQPAVSAVLWLLAAVVLIAPAAIHLTTAATTVVLMVLAPERGGISQSVQVVGYATAPCVLVGIPNAWVGLVGTVWAVDLLVLGLARVHDIPLPAAAIAAAFPATVVFGVGFGGFADLVVVGEQGWALLEPIVG